MYWIGQARKWFDGEIVCSNFWSAVIILGLVICAVASIYVGK